MLKNKVSAKSAHLYNLFAVMLFAIALVACDKPDDPAYLTFSPYSPQKLNKVSQRNFDNSEFQLSAFIIEIKTANNKRISRFDILKSKNEIQIEVPANTGLIVSGIGFVESEIQYEGQVFVNPIKPGKTVSANLILHDVKNADSEIQIDIAIDNSPANGLSKGIRFSRDNNYVLFISNADNLISNDTNETADLFLKNIRLSDTQNLHTDIEGVLGESLISGVVSEADISEDGTYVVFASDAPNLVLDDINNVQDVFLKNTVTSNIERISLDNGLESRNPSYNPQISDDGMIISYFSPTEDSSIAGSIHLINRITNQRIPLAVDSAHYILSGNGKWIVYQNNELQLMLFSIETKNEIAISEEALDYSFNITQNGDYVAFTPKNTGLNLTANQFYVFSPSNQNIRQLSKKLSGENISDNLTQTSLPAISGNGNYVAFSYNNTIYIREHENNNIARVIDGTDPFLSKDGSRLGYTRDNNLFFVNNPIFLNRNIIEKALAPTELTISSFTGGFELNWQNVEGASYYRVFQTNTANIASNRELRDFNAIIYDTTENNLIIDNNLINNNDYYFAVVAINNQGESAISNEVSAVAVIDEIAPTVISLSSPSTIAFTQSNRVFIGFSEAILPRTVNTTSIKLFDALNEPVPISTSISGSNITLTTSSNLLYGENYTVNVSTNLTDLAGNALANEYQNSFIAWQPVNEGSFEIPVPINVGAYQGQVGLGTSYYNFNLPEIPSDQYLIRLNNAPINVTSRLSDGGEFSFQNHPNTTNTYLVNGVDISGSFYLEVNGLETQRGAMYDIEIIDVSHIGASDLGTLTLATLLNTTSNETINLTQLQSNKTYILDFSTTLGSSQIQLQSFFGNRTNCIVSSLNPICEIETNANGEVLLNIRGISDINNLNVNGEILPVSVVDLSVFEFLITAVDELSNFTSRSLYSSGLDTIEPTQLYKYTGLPSDKKHLFFLDTDIPDTSYKLYTNNWKSLECSNILSGNIEELCTFEPQPIDNNFYLRLDINNFDSGGFLEIVLLNNVYDITEFTSFNSIDNPQNFDIFAVTELSANTNYKLTLSGDQIANDSVAILSDNFECTSPTPTTLSKSCYPFSDSFGNIFFYYGNSTVASTVDVLIEEIPRTPLTLDLMQTQAISPVSFFTVNNLTLDSNYIIHTTNYMDHSDQNSEFPFLTVVDGSNDLMRSCYSGSFMHGSLTCLISPSSNFININIEDGNTADNLDISADIIVSEVEIIDITNQTAPLIAQVTSPFSLYVSDLPSFSFVSVIMTNILADSTLSFTIYTDASLSNPVCASTVLPEGIGQQCIDIDFSFGPTIYILVNGIDSLGEEYSLLVADIESLP